jgi:hypothetical protein
MLSRHAELADYIFVCDSSESAMNHAERHAGRDAVWGWRMDWQFGSSSLPPFSANTFQQARRVLRPARQNRRETQRIMRRTPVMQHSASYGISLCGRHNALRHIRGRQALPHLHGAGFPGLL